MNDLLKGFLIGCGGGALLLWCAATAEGPRFGGAASRPHTNRKGTPCPAKEKKARENDDELRNQSVDLFSAVGVGTRHDPHRNLFDAIRWVETKNEVNPPPGDGGKSLGEYQISSAYWTDACVFGGVQWDYHVLVYSRQHCEQVMLFYWDRYGAVDDEDRARLHNGGPTRRGTDEYWRRVKERMDEE